MARKSADVAKVTNEGQRMLLAVPASLAAVATAAGCTKGAAGQWRQGLKLPSDATRLRLFDLYQIPIDAWDRLGPRIIPPDDDEPRAPRSAIEAVDMQLSQLYREQREKGLSSTARAKIADTIGKQLALKARLEAARDGRDDQIVKQHPGWRRIEDLLGWLAERLELVDKPLADEFEKRLEGLAS